MLSSVPLIELFAHTANEHNNLITIRANNSSRTASVNDSALHSGDKYREKGGEIKKTVDRTTVIPWPQTASAEWDLFRVRCEMN